MKLHVVPARPKYNLAKSHRSSPEFNPGGNFAICGGKNACFLCCGQVVHKFLMGEVSIEDYFTDPGKIYQSCSAYLGLVLLFDLLL